MEEVKYVCRHDGVSVASSRGGKLVHVDDLPTGIGPHDVLLISEVSYKVWLTKRQDLVSASTDMLVHHSALCSLEDCGWASRLDTALRSPATA